jgi:hypothetical protein
MCRAKADKRSYTTLRNRYPLLMDDPNSFPRQENKLSAAIRRIIPPLRRMGGAIALIVAAIQVNARSGLKELN